MFRIISIFLLTFSILAGMVLAGSVVDYWNFDEGTGNYANDSVLPNNQGVINGATWISEGKVGGALEFDGVGDGVQISSPFTGIQNNFSIEMYCLFYNFNSFKTLFRQRADYRDVALHYVYQETTPKTIFFSMSGTDGVQHDLLLLSPLETNVWYHIRAVYDGKQMKLYLNNTLDNTLDVEVDISWSENYMRTDIGDSPTSTHIECSFSGIIDEVKITTDVEDRNPPVAVAGDDQEVECTDFNGTQIVLDGSLSYDEDGDALEYTWMLDTDVLYGPSSDPNANVTLPFGEHVITLVVSDGLFESTDQVLVSIVDTTPPALALACDPSVLWPPNHKMVNISVSTTLTDNCDLNSQIELVSIVSNEPDLSKEKEDKSNDIQDAEYGTADTNFLLRAERLGNGNGREYTITYRVIDFSGNSTVEQTTVIVPHDQGKLAKNVFASENEETLYCNYPNPFNPTTTIRFYLLAEGHVNLSIYNNTGTLVEQLIAEKLDEGIHTVVWNAGTHPSGFYFYRLRGQNLDKIGKMLLLK